LIAQVESALAKGVHERVPVSWPEFFSTAEALSAAHGVGTLCRSLDTLHVALALELGATEFRTFDLRQSRMAAAAGLMVIS
jgi:predicted nucleic acid-binding protein